MKKTWLYVAGIVLLFVVLYGLQLAMPTRFSWAPSFAHEDRNPFGCYVFDSVMAQTLPRGYQAQGITLRQAAQDTLEHNVLIIDDQLSLTKANVKDIERLVRHGATVMLVARNIDDGGMLSNRFGFSVSGWGSFNLTNVQYMLSKGEASAYDTIYYGPRPTSEGGSQPYQHRGSAYPPAQYRILKSLITGDVTYQDTAIRRYRLTPVSYSPEQLEGDYNYDHDVCSARAAVCRHGRGQLVVAATPLLFTNYGVLSPSAHPYVMRMMNTLTHRPTIRLDASLTHGAVTGAEADKHNQSPLSYIMSQPPLRWTYYVTLVGVLLFMVFTARRRQRVIPILPAPKNHDMEFVRLIGRLYYEHHDNADLVMKKWAIMADALRTQLDIDMADTRQLQDHIATIAAATGIDRQTIGQLVAEVTEMHTDSLQVTNADMMRLVSQMDHIIKSL